MKRRKAQERKGREGKSGEAKIKGKKKWETTGQGK